jgi:hypothetical protein
VTKIDLLLDRCVPEKFRLTRKLVNRISLSQHSLSIKTRPCGYKSHKYCFRIANF